MSIYNLPLEINDQLFKSTDLAGQGPYYTGYPQIVSALNAQVFAPYVSDVRAVYDPTVFGLPANSAYKPKSYVYICKGPQSLYCDPGKAFVVGADVRVYNKAAVAATKSIVQGRVLSYDVISGLLWIEVYAVKYGLDDTTVELNKIPVGKAKVTMFTGKNVTNGTPRSIATGGFATTDDRAALAALSSKNHTTVSEAMFDFISQAEGPAVLFDNANAYITSYATAQNDPTNHPGIIALGPLTTTAAQRKRTLIISPNARAPTGATVNSAPITNFTSGSTFECLIYIPTLANVTNNYSLSIGLFFFNAASLDAHLNFAYDGNGAANWKIQTQAAGSILNTTTAAVVSTGWNKLRITNTGTVISFSVNGVQIGTANIATQGYFMDLTITGMCVKVIKTWIAGTTPITDVDYVYLNKVFNGGRG